jgi:hypothetical protein
MKMTKAQAAVHYGGLMGVALRLVQELEFDNCGPMCVTPKWAAKLKQGVERMEAAGIKFTPAVVALIAAGDQDMAMTKYRRTPGYRAVNNALNQIFDPPKLVQCAYHKAVKAHYAADIMSVRIMDAAQCKAGVA